MSKSVGGMREVRNHGTKDSEDKGIKDSSPGHSASTRLSILTVGEGDFSCSLAILRAYSFHVGKLVATTLLASESELLETYPYPSTHQTLNELKKPSSQHSNVDVMILFGVDAAHLHTNKTISCMAPYDYILFHHPHLGYARGGSNGTNDLASQHSSLLAHYLYSARQLLVNPAPDHEFAIVEDKVPVEVKTPCVHVCLCAGQSKSWKIKAILSRLHLEYSESPKFASKPLFPNLTAASPRNTQQDTNDQTSYDDSLLKSPRADYWLGQYGYKHQPTHPTTTQLSNSINSHHHFFCRSIRARGALKDCGIWNDYHNCQQDLFGSETSADPDTPDFTVNGNEPNNILCCICHQRFENRKTLQDHLKAPARPIKASLAVEINLEANQRLKRWKQG